MSDMLLTYVPWLVGLCAGTFVGFLIGLSEGKKAGQ